MDEIRESVADYQRRMEEIHRALEATEVGGTYNLGALMKTRFPPTVLRYRVMLLTPLPWASRQEPESRELVFSRSGGHSAHWRRDI